MAKKSDCALVMGGYVNGYSIIQDLHQNGVKSIYLVDKEESVGSFSNKIKKFFKAEMSVGAIRGVLNDLHDEYEKIVIFPTNDLQMEILYELWDEVDEFCFIPTNRINFKRCLEKSYQYAKCEELGVPYPKTVQLNCVDGLKKLKGLYPVIVKPITREDEKTDVFRNLVVNSEGETEKLARIESYLQRGISFIASEIVQGDGSDVSAYVCYRSKEGKILAEWTGSKLAQFPDDFGVFSSATNKTLDLVRVADNQLRVVSGRDILIEQGRKLVEGMDLKGIVEPEFKYDCKDRQFKLMEINLRSMMWHRVGNLSGVSLPYAQYVDAIGSRERLIRTTQHNTRSVHFVYLRYELVNLLRRKDYWALFQHNLCGADMVNLALFEWGDPWPFCMDMWRMLAGYVKKVVYDN